MLPLREMNCISNDTGLLLSGSYQEQGYEQLQSFSLWKDVCILLIWWTHEKSDYYYNKHNAELQWADPCTKVTW